MVSGRVRDVYDALARVSAPAELQRPPKFIENEEPASRILAMVTTSVVIVTQVFIQAGVTKSWIDCITKTQALRSIGN